MANSSSTTIPDLRDQILMNAQFAYQDDNIDLRVVTGSAPAPIPTLMHCPSSNTSLLSVSVVHVDHQHVRSRSLNSVPCSNNLACYSNEHKDTENANARSTSISTNSESSNPTARRCQRREGTTWAALVARRSLGQVAGHTPDRILLKTTDCSTDVEAFQKLHEVVKAEVSKRCLSLPLDDKLVARDADSVEVLEKLPTGWKMKLNDVGMVYFVDTIKKETRFNLPGYTEIRTLKQPVPKIQELKKMARELISQVPHSDDLEAPSNK